jgi:signal recognition particle receptor subunit beta
MQLAAKIVYYGPGLCGKTTNLQQIYEQTAEGSRGEMVSLETATDRTLFFDLLPIEVGSIAGFKTRIQLYTVPGQVFYNTTRKLVLKGVDGVVFVADSQRPMYQANIDSLNNLAENLSGLGLSIDTIPLVLQLNKRDLHEVCSLDELDQSLNRRDWPVVEASALRGDGVFETLKAISRLTLTQLAQRLERETASGRSASGGPLSAPAAGATERGARPLAPSAPSRPAAPEARPAASSNGHGQLSRRIELAVAGDHLVNTRRVKLSLALEDGDDRVLHSTSKEIELEAVPNLEKLLLQLSIQKQS